MVLERIVHLNGTELIKELLLEELELHTSFTILGDINEKVKSPSNKRKRELEVLLVSSSNYARSP